MIALVFISILVSIILAILLTRQMLLKDKAQIQAIYLQDALSEAQFKFAEIEKTFKKYEEDRSAALAKVRQGLADLMARQAVPAAVTTQNALTALPESSSDPHINSSVKERLRKAVEITVLQSKIDPRKGTDFMIQHNELELEKLTVLRSILKDGFDPYITIRYSSGEQEMPLSQYVQSLAKSLA